MKKITEDGDVRKQFDAPENGNQNMCDTRTAHCVQTDKYFFDSDNKFKSNMDSDRIESCTDSETKLTTPVSLVPNIKGAERDLTKSRLAIARKRHVGKVKRIKIRKSKTKPESEINSATVNYNVKVDLSDEPWYVQQRYYQMMQRPKGGSGSFAKQRVICEIDDAVKTGRIHRLSLDYFGPDTVDILTNWKPRLEKCGNEFETYICSEGCHSYTIRHECRVPACPGMESKTITRYSRELDELRSTLRHRSIWKFVRDDIRKKIELNLPQKPSAYSKMYWLFISVGLRSTGDMKADIQKTTELRKLFWRFLKRRKAVAGYISLDCGLKNGHIHLHAVIYSPRIPWQQIATWLQSQDCTVPGCRHLPDDRCDYCKRAKIDCYHFDEGRKRCNGSWNLDIRQVFHTKGIFQYILRPDSPRKKWYKEAATRLAYYLAAYNKPKIKTYGLARPSAGLITKRGKSNKHDCCPKCRGNYIRKIEE